MRRVLRFGVGVVLGGGALAAYLAFVGVGDVVEHAAGVAPWAVGAVVLLVVAEGCADGIGVWASVRPLDGGLTPGQAVQFAWAGDFFDTLSPAGPVSSEPIVARFIGVTTGTTYAEALGVRGVAKYVKSGSQLLVSTGLAVVALAGGPARQDLLVTLGGSTVGLVVLGATLVGFRGPLSSAVAAALTPVVRWVSARYRERPHDGAVVARAVDRFWARALQFRTRPGLLALVALGGVVEQVLTATALWVALAGTGTPVALLPVVAIVPLSQVASVVPIPGSLGAYDVLLAGALVVVTGAPAAAAAAAVLLVRAVTLPFALSAGGFAAAFLRGWRP